MKKILIAYYSRKGENYTNEGITDLEVGNTEIIAKKIEAITGGDLFEIKTVKQYPKGYNETTKVAAQELRAGTRPDLIDLPENIDAYDTIYLGYPNWWGTFPMAVYTFLESYDFKGKRIIPFCTHEGSGMGKSEQDLKNCCEGAIVEKGLAIRGSSVSSADEAIKNWLKK